MGRFFLDFLDDFLDDFLGVPGGGGGGGKDSDPVVVGKLVGSVLLAVLLLVGVVLVLVFVLVHSSTPTVTTPESWCSCGAVRDDDSSSSQSEAYGAVLAVMDRSRDSSAFGFIRRVALPTDFGDRDDDGEVDGCPFFFFVWRFSLFDRGLLVVVVVVAPAAAALALFRSISFIMSVCCLHIRSKSSPAAVSSNRVGSASSSSSKSLPSPVSCCCCCSFLCFRLSIRAVAAQETIQQTLATAERFPPRLMVHPPWSVQMFESKTKKVKLCKKYATRYPKPMGRRLMDFHATEQVRQVVTKMPKTKLRNATDWDTVYMVSSWMSSEVNR